jgi:hypothetical protein
VGQWSRKHNAPTRSPEQMAHAALAQWESKCLTSTRSLVQSRHAVLFCARVAQLDRAMVYEAIGCEFESRLVHFYRSAP